MIAHFTDPVRFGRASGLNLGADEDAALAGDVRWELAVAAQCARQGQREDDPPDHRGSHPNATNLTCTCPRFGVSATVSRSP